MHRLRINKLPEYYGLAHKAQYDNTDFILSKISTKHLIFNFLTYEDKKKITHDVLKHNFISTTVEIKNKDLKLIDYIEEAIWNSKFKTDVTGNVKYNVNIFFLKKNILNLFKKEVFSSIENEFKKEIHFTEYLQLLKQKQELIDELNNKNKRKAKIKANYHTQLLISENDSEHRRRVYNVLRDSLYRTLKILNHVEKKELKKMKIYLSPQDTKQMIDETLKFIKLIDKYRNNFFTEKTLQKLNDLYYMLNEDNVRRVFNSLLDIVNEYHYLELIPAIQKQINVLKNITPIGAAIFSSSFKYLTSFVKEEILKNENYIKETQENLIFTSNKIYDKLLKETSKGISSIYEADLMNIQYELTIINEISTALEAYKQKLHIMKNIHNNSNIKDYNKITNEFFNWFKNIILSLNTWTIRNEWKRAKWIYAIDLEKEAANNQLLKIQISKLDEKLTNDKNKKYQEKYQILFDKQFAKRKNDFLNELQNDKKNIAIFYANKYHLEILKPKYKTVNTNEKQDFIYKVFSNIKNFFDNNELEVQIKNLPPERLLFANIFINGILNREQIVDLDEMDVPLHTFKSIASSISKLEQIISARIVLMSSLCIPTNDNHSLLIASQNYIPVEIATSKSFFKKNVHAYTKLQFESLIELGDNAIDSKTIFNDQIYILPKYDFVKYIEVYKKHFVLIKEKNMKKNKRKRAYEIK